MTSVPGNFAIQGQTNVNETVSTIDTTYDDETSVDDTYDDKFIATDGTDATEENSSDVRIDIVFFASTRFTNNSIFTAKAHGKYVCGKNSWQTNCKWLCKYEH